MNELIDRHIFNLWLSRDQHWLIFDTDKGLIRYKTYGECCSETWFADIVGVDNLLNCKVKDAERMGLLKPEINDDGRGRQESDIHYGVKITTDQGVCDIVYRNSSNGYYSGSIEFTTDTSPADLDSITKDYPV